MTKHTAPADGGATPASLEMPDIIEATTASEMALALVIALRIAGHRPRVIDGGRFYIELQVSPPTRPEPPHHLGPGYCYFLGFDDRVFAPLFANPDKLALLKSATLELEASI